MKKVRNSLTWFSHSEQAKSHSVSGWPLRPRDPNWQGTIHHAHGSKPITETHQGTVFLLGRPDRAKNNAPTTNEKRRERHTAERRQRARAPTTDDKGENGTPSSMMSGIATSHKLLAFQVTPHHGRCPPPQQGNFPETQKTCAIQTYPRWT